MFIFVKSIDQTDVLINISHISAVTETKNGGSLIYIDGITVGTSASPSTVAQAISEAEKKESV